MNEKTIIVPDHYKRFVCAADRCPDTCCKGWDIVVDDETLAFYRETGDKRLLERIAPDSDGDMVITFENGVCPFLEGGLCSVQKRYGERRICTTCRVFPRVCHDYTEFEERLLTLACPETARLMIVGREDFRELDGLRVSRTDNGYLREYMNFLLAVRERTFSLLRSDEPFVQKMKSVFSFTEHAQALIDNEIFDEARLDGCPDLAFCGTVQDRARIFGLHSRLDVMDENWLAEAVSCKDEALPDSIDGELASLVLYYAARYTLTAVSSYDVITTIKRAWCAAVVCGALISRENAENDPLRRALIYQKYSKEIEHSDENLDIMTDEFLCGELYSQRMIGNY